MLLDDIKETRKQSQMGNEAKEQGEMQLDRWWRGEHPWRDYLPRLD